jgi:hypothetical protein
MILMIFNIDTISYSTEIERLLVSLTKSLVTVMAYLRSRGVQHSTEGIMSVVEMSTLPLTPSLVVRPEGSIFIFVFLRKMEGLSTQADHGFVVESPMAKTENTAGTIRIYNSSSSIISSIPASIG